LYEEAVNPESAKDFVRYPSSAKLGVLFVAALP
jgi:hypothetical protein